MPANPAHPSGTQALRLLALDTSTDQLSVALGLWPAGSAAAAPTQLWQHTGAGAAQSSATLIPAIQNLLEQADMALAQLNAIVFGSGPGSFTGLRTACAVAQGLALGANLPVLPIDTLQATAQDWRSRHAPAPASGSVWALLDARMDEIYAAHWHWHTSGSGEAAHIHWHCVCDALLVKPEQITQLPGFAANAMCAGNVQAAYGTRLPLCVRPAMPTAQAMLQLAPELLQQGAACDPALALPRYVRDKVAQTTAERTALQQAQQVQQAQQAQPAQAHAAAGNTASA